MAEVVDTIVVKLVADVDEAQRKVATYGGVAEQAFGKVAASAASNEQVVTRSADDQRAAIRGVSEQLSKVVIDIAKGGDALSVFGAHGTEVGGALEKFGGVVGTVGGFLSGPWGFAITTAASLFAEFASRSGQSSAAMREHGIAASALRDAIAKLDETTGRHLMTVDEQIRADRTGAQKKLRELLRQQKEKRAALARVEGTDVSRGPRGDGGNWGASFLKDMLSGDMREALAQADKDIARTMAALRDADSAVALLDIEDEFDPVRAAQRRYGNRVSADRNLREAGKISAAEFEQRARDHAATRERETAAATPAVSLPATAAPPSTPRGPTPAEERAGYHDPITDIPTAISIGIDTAQLADVEAVIAELAAREVPLFDKIDMHQVEAMAKISADLADNIAQGLTDAIVAGKSLGDVLVDAFSRAGAALIQSQISRLLNPGGDGTGGLVGGVSGFLETLVRVRTPQRRASGGHVSAGQLYRVNEVGIEGFRPAGSGTIVPLGRMAAARSGGGVTVVQPLNVSFAGAITTPELMAQFKAYADGVGQAAAIGGAAMAQARMSRRAARSLPR